MKMVLELLRGFFRKPAVTNVVNQVEETAKEAGKAAADSFADSAVAETAKLLRRKVESERVLAPARKQEYLQLIDRLEAAVKALYGDGK